MTPDLIVLHLPHWVTGEYIRFWPMSVSTMAFRMTVPHGDFTKLDETIGELHMPCTPMQQWSLSGSATPR